MTGDLFTPLNELENVTTVRIGENKFQGSLSDSESINLIEFDAFLNDFDSNLDNFLINNPNLQVLDLEGNRFTGNLPSELTDLQLIQLFLSNNDFSGEIPEHEATDTDSVPGEDVSSSSFSDNWFKFTLNEKCPNRFSFAIEKAFKEAPEFSVPLTIVFVLVATLCCTGCIFCCVRFKIRRYKMKAALQEEGENREINKSTKRLRKKRRLRGKSRRTRSSRVAKRGSDLSTEYDENHYKIEVYTCKPTADLIKSEQFLVKKLRGMLKKQQVKVDFPHLKPSEKINDVAMSEAAAVLIFYNEDYAKELTVNGTKAFTEIFRAQESGQWVIMACLDKKLYNRSVGIEIVEDAFLMDCSSVQAINKGFEELMKHLLKAQVEKDYILEERAKE